MELKDSLALCPKLFNSYQKGKGGCQYPWVETDRIIWAMACQDGIPNLNYGGGIKQRRKLA